MPFSAPKSPVRVPLIDLGASYGELEDDLVAAFRRTLRSGRYILGPEVEAFERRVSQRLGAKHCIAVSSGTDALLAALLALQLGPGDEVITSPFTFVSTAEVIARVGATPVFADVCPQCLCLDPAAVASRVTPRTRAIMPVHLYGELGHVEELLCMARRLGLFVVEDACQAFGAQTAAAQSAGTLGDIGCFSFFPTKVLGAMGDAGLLCTENTSLADRLRSLRSHGSSDKHSFRYLGGNFRIDALHAALLSVLLSRLDDWIAARRAIADTYTKALSAVRSITTPQACCAGTRVWSVYTIRANRDRNGLANYLQNAGIETGVYYPATLADQPVFESTQTAADSIAQAKQASREVLSLPIYPGIPPTSLAFVIQCIREHANLQDDYSHDQPRF